MSEPIEGQQQETQPIAEETPAKEVASRAEPVNDNSDAEMDAVLDRLLGVDKADTQAVPPPQERQADPDTDRAVKALQRDGVPQDVIEAMRSDPSKLKEWGLKAAKRQADVDAFGAKVAQSKETKPSESPKGSVESQDAESDADPLSEFDDIFGDGAAKPIRTVADRLRSEMDARTKALETQVQTLSSYQRLSRDLGADAPDIDAVVAKAAEIGSANPGSFESVDAIVREAFRQLTEGRKPVRRDVRDMSRPTVGKSLPRPQKQVDRDDLALDVLLSGGSRDDVRRVLTR